MIIDKELFFSLLNNQHPKAPKPFNDKNIIINEPESFDDNGRGEVNYRILLEAVSGSGYTGQAYVYFNGNFGKKVINIPIDYEVSWQYIIDIVNDIQGTSFTRADFPDYELTLDTLPVSFIVEYNKKYLFGDSEFEVNVYLSSGLFYLLKQDSIAPAFITRIQTDPILSSLSGNMYLNKALNLNDALGQFTIGDLRPGLIMPARRLALLKPELQITSIAPSLRYSLPVIAELPDQITDRVLLPDISPPEPLEGFIYSDLLPGLELLPYIADINNDYLPALRIHNVIGNQVDNTNLEDQLNITPPITDYINRRLGEALIAPVQSDIDIDHELLPQLILEELIQDIINVDLLPGLNVKSGDYGISDINNELQPQLTAPYSLASVVEYDIDGQLHLDEPLPTLLNTDLLDALIEPVPDPSLNDIDSKLLPAIIGPELTFTVRDSVKELLPALIKPQGINQTLDKDMLPALNGPELKLSLSEVNKDLLPALQPTPLLEELFPVIHLPDQLRPTTPLSGLDLNGGGDIEIADALKIWLNKDLTPGLIEPTPDPKTSDINKQLMPALVVENTINELIDKDYEDQLHLSDPLRVSVEDKSFFPQLFVYRALPKFARYRYMLPELEPFYNQFGLDINEITTLHDLEPELVNNPDGQAIDMTDVISTITLLPDIELDYSVFPDKLNDLMTNKEVTDELDVSDLNE